VRLEAKAVVVPGDDIDTDVLYPGAYLNVTDVEAMKQYLFEGLDSSLRDQLGGETALVVGANFGAGSSREHVPQAMHAWGVRFLVGRSFARIFARNCLNLGLPIVTCAPAAEAAVPGSDIALDVDEGRVEVDGAAFPIPPFPPFMREMMASGGLVPWVRGNLDATTRVV
jgi:3-isopropylmalate/(R)-2-methylmalate dehydratase small subunit